MKVHNAMGDVMGDVMLGDGTVMKLDDHLPTTDCSRSHSSSVYLGYNTKALYAFISGNKVVNYASNK